MTIILITQIIKLLYETNLLYGDFGDSGQACTNGPKSSSGHLINEGDSLLSAQNRFLTGSGQHLLSAVILLDDSVWRSMSLNYVVHCL